MFQLSIGYWGLDKEVYWFIPNVEASLIIYNRGTQSQVEQHDKIFKGMLMLQLCISMPVLNTASTPEFRWTV